MDVRTTPLGGRRLAAALGVWIVASGVAGGSTAVLWRLARQGPDDPALITVIVFEVYALLIASLYFGAGGRERPATLGLRPVSIRSVALAGAVGASSWAVVAAAYVALDSWPVLLGALRWIGSDGGRLSALGMIAGSFSVARACVLAPIGEELLFRGALFGWLRNRVPPWPAIMMTSVLFAAIHFMPAIMPVAFAVGLGLAWVRERTGSTLPGIVFHLAQNILIVAAF